MENSNKKVVSIEIGDEVEKLTVTGENKDQQVVMREELSDDELNAVSGGKLSDFFSKMNCKTKKG